MEDHTAIGGFGSLAASALATWGTSCRHLPVAWPFPVGFAESCDILERRCRQTVRNIFLRILNALQLPCD
jgi:hypothetical protein